MSFVDLGRNLIEVRVGRLLRSEFAPRTIGWSCEHRSKEGEINIISGVALVTW